MGCGVKGKVVTKGGIEVGTGINMWNEKKYCFLKTKLINKNEILQRNQYRKKNQKDGIYNILFIYSLLNNKIKSDKD